MWVWIAKITIPDYEGYQQNSLSGNVHNVYRLRAPYLLSPLMCAGSLANLTSPGPSNCTGFPLQSWHAPPLLQTPVSQHTLRASSLPTWHCHILRPRVRPAAWQESFKEHSWHWQRRMGQYFLSVAAQPPHTPSGLFEILTAVSASLPSPNSLVTWLWAVVALSDSSAPQTAANI